MRPVRRIELVRRGRLMMVRRHDSQPQTIRPGRRRDRRGAGLERPRRRIENRLARATRSLSRRRRVGRSRPDSVILWTRRPFDGGDAAAADRRGRRGRRRSGASSRRRRRRSRPRPTGPAGCWSAGLKPARDYWYRFTDADGNGSRIGRTITAPRPDDPRPVNFAFVSCQTVNEGTLNGYRRMIFEDERARARRAARLRPAPRRFHLRGRPVSRGSEDPLRPDDLRGRPHLRTRIKVGNFHIPTTVDGYRAV